MTLYLEVNVLCCWIYLHLSMWHQVLGMRKMQLVCIFFLETNIWTVILSIFNDFFRRMHDGGEIDVRACYTAISVSMQWCWKVNNLSLFRLENSANYYRSNVSFGCIYINISSVFMFNLCTTVFKVILCDKLAIFCWPGCKSPEYFGWWTCSKCWKLYLKVSI